MWDAGFSPEAKSFEELDLAQKYGGWVVRLHRGDLDGAPGRGVGARRSPGARRGPRGSTCGPGRRSRPRGRRSTLARRSTVGRAARRADLDGAPGVRRSTLRQALDVAARLDVRTWTALPARGRRSTLRQALSCARVIRIFLGQPCRTALLWVWVGEATWPVAGLLHRPRRRYRARSRTGGGQGRSGSTWQRGSTCGPWTALPGGKALDARPGARRGQRGSTCGPWTALPAAGSALDARQALDVGSAARRADLDARSDLSAPRCVT